MEHTKKSYTNFSRAANVASDDANGMAPERLSRIVWEPGTLEALRDFPDSPRQTLGHYLYLVQKGEIPPTSTPVPGVPDAFELRDEDASNWYRVVHLKKIGDTIHVIHCFEKQSNKIEKRDIRTIKQRLGRLNQWLAEKKRNAKRGRKG